MSQITLEELDDYIFDLSSKYQGDLTVLANAIGALNLGKIYGWRVIRIIYSPLTYRKYQKTLNLEFKNVLPEVTDFSKRSKGFQLVSGINKYWKAVSGEFHIDSKERREAVS
ncbi:MAG: hypothetical protein PHN45_08090 [Methylococcales bacterium]|nr:hypothetical protein [Methylococcales bacterium]